MQLPQEPLQTQVSLPAKSWYDAAADVASVVASSPYAQMIYWGEFLECYRSPVSSLVLQRLTSALGTVVKSSPYAQMIYWGEFLISGSMT